MALRLTLPPRHVGFAEAAATRAFDSRAASVILPHIGLL
jgi:hypothetical protein